MPRNKLTAAERALSAERKMEADRKRQRLSRQNESKQQRDDRLACLRSHASTSRDMESEDVRQARLTADRASTSTSRENESEEAHEARLYTDRASTSTSRENESDEARQIRLAIERRRIATRRARPRSRYLARNIDNIFTGQQNVAYVSLGPLFRTDGTPPGVVCKHCKAVRWKNEPPSMCCALGKAQLKTIFEDTPCVFRALWEGADQDAKTFRKYARPLNNALSLACLKMKDAAVPGHGWAPSITIQGKVFVRMGPLRADDGQPPVFAQLYTLDPDQDETEIRLRNMRLPPSATPIELIRLRRLLGLLQTELKECNSYVRDFQHAHETMSADDSQNVKLVLNETKRPDGTHPRQFNTGYKEISVLMDDEHPGNRDFVVVHRGAGRHSEEILDTHRSADALHFVLLFPTGEDSWNIGLRQNANSQRNCSPLQFYAFHLQHRYDPTLDLPLSHGILLRGCKLLQEFVCMAFAKVENQRLMYIKHNQTTLRAETYNRIAEDVYRHQQTGHDGPVRSGQQVILPPSFTGGARYMHQHFQNGTAIIREYHKPDIFLTVTCNSQWPEITASLLAGQLPHDRPDLVARVFRLKLQQLTDDLFKAEILGRRAADIYVIEFQKRGLPHAHLLLILHHEDRLHTADDADMVISAELPADPTDFPPGPERDQADKLQQAVLKHMVHSCGAQCKDEMGRCKKFFPKDFADTTVWEENAYYPAYRRRGPETESDRDSLHQRHALTAEDSHGREINNGYIVPYSPYLLLKYDAHINVELCVSALAAKYLFKYIHKGSDRAMAGVDVANDEVKQYQNLRSIGSSEACWRMYQFDITHNYPTVQALRVHLEGRQYVTFAAGEEEDIVHAGPPSTELDAFFEYNRRHGDCNVRYVDFPKTYVWDAPRAPKEWSTRQRGIGTTIGRIHTIHPLSGDEFYLRILLHHEHCQGATSYTHLRQIDGEQFDSCKEVCRRLGLLRDDREWHDVLAEANQSKMCSQIRRLFIVIILYCETTDARSLYDNHCSEWGDDFHRRYPIATDPQVRTMVLLDLEENLRQSGCELSQFNLPSVTHEEREEIEALKQQSEGPHLSVSQQDELDFDLDTTQRDRDARVAQLTQAQKAVFDRVMAAVIDGTPLALFLNARGGTGKTYTLNAILAAARTLNDTKNIAIAVASSGIAATLLQLGRTFHSRFKAPLNCTATSTLKIKMTDTLGKLVLESKLIIWDEAPMGHRHLLEALDRTLRDICQCDQPFGGKVVILSGDFCQVLPVIKRGSRPQIIDASIKGSPLWPHFSVMELTENLRVGQAPERQAFDKWLVKLGNGEFPAVAKPDLIQLFENTVVDIDDESFTTVAKSMSDFVDTIFPGLLERAVNPSASLGWLSERAILAPRNVEVDTINALVTARFPGQMVVRYSADSTCDEGDATRFPIEYLNSLMPPGLPPYDLRLKDGIVLMLLRNLCPRQGLSNGTRLILLSSTQRLLTCKIAIAPDASQKSVWSARFDELAPDGSSLTVTPTAHNEATASYTAAVRSETGVDLAEAIRKHGAEHGTDDGKAKGEASLDDKVDSIVEEVETESKDADETTGVLTDTGVFDSSTYSTHSDKSVSAVAEVVLVDDQQSEIEAEEAVGPADAASELEKRVTEVRVSLEKDKNSKSADVVE